MQPLHTSCALPAFLKLHRSPDGSGLELRHDAGPAFLGAALVLALGCSASFLSAYMLPAGLEIRNPMILGTLAAGTAAAAGIAAHALAVLRKPPLLNYQKAADTLVIARPAHQIANASDRVEFSSEHFIGADNGNRYELSLVLDGERRKFLSSLLSFNRLASQINQMGFRVSEYTVKL
jgi:hypothetical protein